MQTASKEWMTLFHHGSPRTYLPGRPLMRQGESATHVLAVVSGQVKVLQTQEDGSELLLAVRGRGELLGEYSVLGGSTRSATVTALTRVEAKMLTADRFVVLLQRHGLSWDLLRHAYGRVREGEAWRAEMATLPAGRLLARALLRLSQATPGEVPLDQTDLGSATGLARSTVAAELGTLRDLGVVVTLRRRVRILDGDALAALAGLSQPNV
ncbi:cyclic nucleotide-binding domain-containing protein [Actinocorallia sp. API 0066]|uniref:Crp/Fnr family transcriptional regulator n=1 Tax=Actinocorallia sp. API 0066 TaxID=2896846 RepID=UPI001E40AA9C|nr:cyclic nucleotide-binding domain-containing protein [Actinocorallia sp. API 0066]MCD0450010.1 cyclic nucleotide-binding domain-containing protein [Actinocorallia sp. API 0066]